MLKLFCKKKKFISNVVILVISYHSRYSSLHMSSLKHKVIDRWIDESSEVLKNQQLSICDHVTVVPPRG